MVQFTAWHPSNHEPQRVTRSATYLEARTMAAFYRALGFKVEINGVDPRSQTSAPRGKKAPKLTANLATQIMADDRLTAEQKIELIGKLLKGGN